MNFISRQNLLQSKVFKVLFIFFIVLLAGAPLLTILIGRTQDTWIIKVNGQKIDSKTFYQKIAQKDEQINFLKEQYELHYGQNAHALLNMLGLLANNSKELVFDEMVRNTLVSQAAHKLDLHAHDDFIQEKLSDANFLSRNLEGIVPFAVLDQRMGINKDELKKYLRITRSTLGDFEKEIYEGLLRFILHQIVAISAYVPTFELRDFYAREYLGKKFSILTVPFSKELAEVKKTPIPADTLTTFFTTMSQQGHYWIPEKRTGKVWNVDPSTYGISITQEQIAAYYAENKLAKFVDQPSKIEVRRILFTVDKNQDEQDVRKKIQTLHQELLKNPASFAQKAHELSHDKEHAKNGGLLPVFAKGSQEATFDRASFLLKNDGDISDVIRTSKGLEIIQRVRKIAPTFKPLNVVSKEIRGLLLQEKFNQQFIHDIEALISQPDPQAKLTHFLQQHGATATTQEFLKDESSKSAEAIFTILKVNEATAFAHENKGVVILLEKIQRRYLPTLNAIKDAVTNDFYTERATQRMQETLKTIHNKATGNAPVSFGALASEYGLTLKKTEMLQPGVEKSLALSRSQGLPVENMLKLERIGAVAVAHKDHNGYIVKVDDLEPFNQADFESKRLSIYKKIQQEQFRACTEGFIASLYGNATIIKNESILDGKELAADDSLMNEFESCI